MRRFGKQAYLVSYPWAGVATQSSFHQGSVYTLYSEHYLVAYNEYSEGTYYNPFQYPAGSYYFAPGEGGDQSGMGFAPGGGTVYVQTEFIYLGYTDVQVSTGPPAVTSISPQYDVQGASGTIHVQGHRLLDDFNYLNAYFRNDTDITASVNLNNASESQADVNYTVSPTAAMGAHQLYMQNTWGDS